MNYIDLIKESAAMLIRSSQEHWKVNELVKARVQGVGCLKMRLEHKTAMSIFGTATIPIISSKDPLTAKLMRAAHLANRDGPRAIHNLTKTTMANLLRGELATFWKGQKKDVTRLIHNCDICRRFDERSCRPMMGRSLFRCKVGTQPSGKC